VTEAAKLVDYLRRVTAELRRTRERLRELEDQHRARIAIVGMSCRYPGGVETPDQLWDLLAGERDAAGPVPAGRGWDPSAVGGFLDDVAGFDAAFFGISPREALAMDPQQRIALEVGWAALEHAGLDPLALRGSDTAVYVGANQQSYGPELHRSPEIVAGHRLTGAATSVISGRISYALGLHGTAVTIDTACSSSLVALHLAATAMQRGEAKLALVGGVTVMSTPGTVIEFGRQGALAADGRCKSFAADADGTGLAEGAGFLVLERLSDAREHGRTVWGVLRGSATNSDGASNGLSAPSGPAQRRVLAAALADAVLTPAEVDAVEAHGTGTVLGDPIEANALLTVYGRDRDPATPLWLGSLKSNIGHTQAAAGVGGVIKMLLAMRHGLLPRSLHLGTPTPHVEWSSGAVRLLDAARPWPTSDRPRRAGVSSFGISGTNVHVILEEPPPVEDREPQPSTCPVWLVSGRTEPALREQAARLREHLRERPELAVADVAHTLATARPTWEHRAALLGRDRAALMDQLDAVATGRVAGLPRTGRARRGDLVFLFSGQGGQRAGMGAGLAEAFPVFAMAFDEVCAEINPLLGQSLRDRVFTKENDLTATALAQPALFALQVALFRLVESWGLRPDVLVGHSVGEIAAAHVGGVLSLADAAALVVARGGLMQALPASGAMLAVEASEEQARAWLSGPVEIAAVNGPRSVVVSGATDAVDAVAAKARAEGRRSRRLVVSHAFHSPLLDPVLDELRAVAGRLTFQPTRLPIVSTLTGKVGGHDTTEYWVRQAREPVRFAEAITAVLDRPGTPSFLELGPDGALCAQAPGDAVPALQRGVDERPAVLKALARLHVTGHSARWPDLLPGRTVPLPTYPFQHQHFWLSGEQAATTLSTRTHPWLGDHVIGGSVLLPGTEFLRLALGAAVGRSLAELVLHTPLDLSEDRTAEVRVEVDGDQLRISSREPGAAWREHAAGALAPASPEPEPEPDGWSVADAEPVDLSEHYASCTARGVRYGPAFRGLVAAWRAGNQLLVRTAASNGLDDVVPFHAAALDAALQALLLDERHPVALPYTWSGVRVGRPATSGLLARITPTGDNTFSVVVFDEHHRLVLTVDRLETRPLPSMLSRLRWTATDIVAPTEDTFVVRASGTVRDAVVQQLRLLPRLLAEHNHLTLVTTSATTDDPDLTAAAVRGLWLSATTENPRRLTILDTDGSPASNAALPGVLGTRLPQLRLVDGRAEVPTLEAFATNGTPRFDPQGTVLITGGTGALGSRLARYLRDRHGVRQLVLTSRRGPTAPGADRLRDELGAIVTAHDLGDPDQVADLLASIPAAHPLTAVVHTAGVTADGALTSLGEAEVDAVFRAKVDGAWHLHEQTRHLDLPVFCLYSSAAGVLGTAGQANYAAANAFLDALARHRVAQGLAAQSIAWGWWDGVGMTESLTERDRHRLRRLGLRPITVDQGHALFDQSLMANEPNVIAARLGPTNAHADIEPEERPLVDVVRAAMARALGHTSTDAVPEDAELGALGLDSLTVLELRTALAEATGIRLPIPVLLRQHTPLDLARHLQRKQDET
jgi:acyl transferase domain-containing protein/acyl carrier protein